MHVYEGYSVGFFSDQDRFHTSLFVYSLPSMPELAVSPIPCPVIPCFELERQVQPCPTAASPARAALDRPLGSTAGGDAQSCRRRAR